MPDVFIVSDNILSPLGVTTAANFAQLTKGVSGVKRHDDPVMSDQPFYAALFDGIPADPRGLDKITYGKEEYTKFEQLLIVSISGALQNSGIDTRDKKTILIISSTKGNIGLLETDANHSGLMGRTDKPVLSERVASQVLSERVALHGSARLVAGYFNFVNPAIVVSNACISGVMAILTGMRMLRSGLYENAVIAGADTISKFILSGFQAFQATSSGLCKPFDRDRDGINLGEGAGTLILSSNPKYAGGIKILGGSISNDANHLSAPSRTGEELCGAINKALGDARLVPSDIDFISAHGTATAYNDEMEAKAITLANLQSAPLNSLKGYYGHTLGAAGLIETIISSHSLKENLVFPTLGFENQGVTKPLNICTQLLHAPLHYCLKTASGFGGCNAALVLGKS